MKKKEKKKKILDKIVIWAVFSSIIASVYWIKVYSEKKKILYYKKVTFLQWLKTWYKKIKQKIISIIKKKKIKKKN